MENDFMKRGYLLPDGCKDLIDVLKTPTCPIDALTTPKCSKYPIIKLPMLPPGGPSGVPASVVPTQHLNAVLKQFASKVPKKHSWWKFWKS